MVLTFLLMIVLQGRSGRLQIELGWWMPMFRGEVENVDAMADRYR